MANKHVAAAKHFELSREGVVYAALAHRPVPTGRVGIAFVEAAKATATLYFPQVLANTK
jgi:hypothetical protein